VERERAKLDRWERKRGKLEQLNQFLIGESTPELEGFLLRAIVRNSRAFVSSSLWMPIPNCCVTPPGG
jgi:hypothetical protein